MRKNSFRTLVTAAVFSVSALLLACPMGPLHVLIKDFQTADVQGIQVYRCVNDKCDVDAGKIEFGAIGKDKSGGETIEYTLLSRDDVKTYGPLHAAVVRDPSQPAALELTLAFYNELPSGWFRVASYNTYGPSGLSVDSQGRPAQAFFRGAEG